MTFSWTCMLLLLFLQFSLRANDLPTQTCRVLTSVFPECVVQHFVVHFYQSGFFYTWCYHTCLNIFDVARILIQKCISRQFWYFIYFKIGLGFVSRSLQNFISYQCMPQTLMSSIYYKVTLQIVTERTIKSLKLLLKPMQYLLGKKYNCREINKSKKHSYLNFFTQKLPGNQFSFLKYVDYNYSFLTSWTLHCISNLCTSMLSSYHLISYNSWYQNINLTQITWTLLAQVSSSCVFD